jgi:drug/metabolite transporter (DMT)-like permease
VHAAHRPPPEGPLAATPRLGRGRRLGICYFGLFIVFYNTAVSYTTAARASLALSTLPLQTIAVGAVLGDEPLNARKTAGVLIAMLGVVGALASGLASSAGRLAR